MLNDKLKSFLKSIGCKPVRIKINNNFSVLTTIRKTGSEAITHNFKSLNINPHSEHFL